VFSKRFLPIVFMVMVLLFALTMAAGVVRYGSFQALVLRVRAEFGLMEARDPYVPTPLPTPIAPAVAQAETASSATATPLPTATATSTPTEAPSTATPEPSAQPSPTPTATATATATQAYLPARDAVALGGMDHHWQTWSNCGPATLSMYLSYYGVRLSQEEIRTVIRPNWEDKHAGPYDMAEYARAQGLNALVRVNGDAERLRLLLSNGVPVMAPAWYIDYKGEQMGHYRLITGYDDEAQEWIVWDSLEKRGVSADQPYAGVRIGYKEMETLWPVYNRLYIIVYDDARAEMVHGVIGEDLDDEIMWQRSLERAEAWLAAEPENAFAWFTLGTNLLHNGRSEEAAAAYDRARIIGLPYRMMWYQFGAFEAYYNVGRYDEVIALADATIRVTGDVEELHYWRGLALEAKGDLDGARAALRTALEKKHNYAAAREALERLGE
jgi:tetratricopeptide (TPR) repeat protein